MIENIDIDLFYQPNIEKPPLNPTQLQERATSADGATVDHWREKWVGQYETNHKYFGSFGDKSVGKLHGINRHRPAIVIGSGPSLKKSLKALRDNAKCKNPVLTVSCLHNLGYFTDEGIDIDYYVTLDAGDIVIKDISENRAKKDYWKATKDKKLIAYCASPPELLKKWQGEIYLFNSMIPDRDIVAIQNKVERFSHYVSSGGNALGACMYIAKAIMGSNPIMYVGADFCFSYDNTFHAYKTSYDNLGGVVTHPDVFGIPRKTWPSYLNFKFWFDKIAMTVPGEWINCSFGLLGAYMGGNIRHYKYAPLETALVPYNISETVEIEKYGDNSKIKLELDEFFNNPQHEVDVVLF